MADLVVFDPDRVRDRATYAEPLTPPSGIEHVILGGHHVVREGEHTGARHGRFLRAA